MEKIVIFTGAGMSAESGIQTFRDSDGLWENYSIEDVATPEAFQRNPELVLEFYNARRKNVMEAQPNDAHYAIANLEKTKDVHIITQNIDDLHERAGSKSTLHLHGQIMYGKNSEGINEEYEYIESGRIELGQKANNGSQLRPHVVWFGEAVPAMDDAIKTCMDANVFVVIGSSLQVYPAASLTQFIPENCKAYIIDPSDVPITSNFTHIKKGAIEGVNELINILEEKKR